MYPKVGRYLWGKFRGTLKVSMKGHDHVGNYKTCDHGTDWIRKTHSGGMYLRVGNSYPNLLLPKQNKRANFEYGPL